MTEYVEVTIKVPKGILDFLEDMKACLNGTVQEYMEYDIVESVRAHIEAGDFFSPTQKEVVEKYHLEGVFDS